MKPSIKVILVEDHEGYREVIIRILNSVNEIELISRFGTAEIALRNVQNAKPDCSPDIILLDLKLPGMGGLEAISWFRKYAPKAKIIILTQSDKEADILRAISLGASGYLLKSATADQIKDGINLVSNGGASLDPDIAKCIINTLKERTPELLGAKISLSGRELEVLTLMGEGMVKKEIAEHLQISVTTVAYHIKHIYKKMEVKNAPSAVAKGYRAGLL